MGRKPLDRETAIIRNVFNPKRHGEKLEADIKHPPEMPRWLPKEARVYFRDFVSALAHVEGLKISVIDSEAIATYAFCRLEFDKASEEIKKDGPTQWNPSTGCGSAHPAIRRRNEALSRMRELQKSFGMTPADRIKGSDSEPKRSKLQLMKDARAARKSRKA